MILRALVLWLVMALAEVLHGILRVKLLNRRVGDHRARQIGVVTGSGIIVAIAGASAPWLGASTTNQLLGIGLLWLLLSAEFMPAGIARRDGMHAEKQRFPRWRCGPELRPRGPNSVCRLIRSV